MGSEILDEIFAVIMDRIKNPRPDSYVCRVLSEGMAADKVEEESRELLEAADGGGKDEIIHEAADLIFHVMVLLAKTGVRLDEVMKELERRKKKNEAERRKR
ncbi:MAG: phosphoribosyl-ATP diphosphatase [Candidatus Hadarchaeales archaeon]